MEISEIQEYLVRTLGYEISVIADGMPQLPFFVRKQFLFYISELYGKKVCFLVSKNTSFAKHKVQELESSAQLVKEKSNVLPVFVFPSMSKQERLVLIKRGLSFIVPNLQMFLPNLGIDLYDRIPMTMQKTETHLRPAAQAMLIEQLLTGSLQGLSVNKASSVMGFTAMGALRAANQLNELNLCTVISDGVSKKLNFASDRKKLWMDAAAFLRNPVKKTCSVEDDAVLSKFPFAGEFALRGHSDLAVFRKCYALHQTVFSRLVSEGKLQVADVPGSGVADVQIWSYTLPSWNDEVDLFSLELSFKGTSDPRIKIALLNIEEQRQW